MLDILASLLYNRRKRQFYFLSIVSTYPQGFRYIYYIYIDRYEFLGANGNLTAAFV